jgi:hypothetical protein
MSQKIRTIEISPHLICGMMLGVEVVQDDGWTSLVVDLLILRIMISWD